VARVAAERREEHRRAEPVLVDFLAGLAGAEGREEEPALAQPERDAANQLALLAPRYVPEEVERHDRVERAVRDVQVERIGVHERRLGNVVAGELDLHGGDVHSGHAMSPCEVSRAWHPAPAAELEHVRAVGETRVEIAQPLERR